MTSQCGKMVIFSESTECHWLYFKSFVTRISYFWIHSVAWLSANTQQNMNAARVFFHAQFGISKRHIEMARNWPYAKSIEISSINVYTFVHNNWIWINKNKTYSKLSEIVICCLHSLIIHEKYHFVEGSNMYVCHELMNEWSRFVLLLQNESTDIILSIRTAVLCARIPPCPQTTSKDPNIL